MVRRAGRTAERAVDPIGLRARLRTQRVLAGLLLLAITAVGIATLPLIGVIGMTRLVVLALAVTGLRLTVAVAGVADLGAAAPMLSGAAATVAVVEAGAPIAVALPVGALAGAATGAALVSLTARVGITIGALTTLAGNAAIVAIVRAWPTGGGASGYHAVPLLTGTDRADLAVAGLLLAVVVVAVDGVAWSSAAARARVAASAPHISRAEGHRPALVLGGLGAAAGGVLGLGGVLLATSTGSVVADGFGLSLATVLLVAALVGGDGILGGVLGVLVVVGPSVLFPTLPVIGDGPPLLALGPVALILLARRPAGFGALFLARRSSGDRTDDTTDDEARDAGEASQAREDAIRFVTARGLSLRATDVVSSAAPSTGSSPPPAEEADTPRLRTTIRAFRDGADGDLPLALDAGDVVAIVGPNGVGKSTVLARIGGQLPDLAPVFVDGGRRAPGPAGAAKVGIVRTWQRPPRLSARVGAGVAPLVGLDDADLPVARWAGRVLTDAGATDEDAVAQLVRAVARRPRVLLLDEPAARLPATAVAAIVQAMAASGTAVVLVEHRPEVIALADRVITLGRAATDMPAQAAAPQDARAGESMTTEAAAASAADERVVLGAGGHSVAAPRGRVTEVHEPTLHAAVLDGGATLEVDGRVVDLDAVGRTRRAGVGVLRRAEVAGELSVRDHLAVVAGRGAAVRRLAAVPLLADRGRDPAGVLSGGERQALAVERAVLLGTSCVIAVDPLLGMDPVTAAWARARLDEAAAAGAAVLLLGA